MSRPIRYIVISPIRDEELPEVNLCVAIALFSALASCAHSSIFALPAYEVAWWEVYGFEGRAVFCDETLFPQPALTGI